MRIINLKGFVFQVTVVTKDDGLRRRLHDEQSHLFKHSAPVTEETFLEADRAVPNWVRMVVRTARNFF